MQKVGVGPDRGGCEPTPGARGEVAVHKHIVAICRDLYKMRLDFGDPVSLARFGDDPRAALDRSVCDSAIKIDE